MTPKLRRKGASARSLRKDTTGGTLPEYAFILGIAALTVAAGVRHLGNTLHSALRFDIATVISEAGSDVPDSGADSGSGGEGDDRTEDSGDDDDSDGDD